MPRCTTVLIVEDHPDVRRTLRDFVQMVLRELMPQPAEVLLASGAAEALQILASRRVDLVLVDHDMPDMDGLDLIKAIPRTPRIPIVLTTASVAVAYWSRTSGADAVLEKPLVHSELKAVLERLLPSPAASEPEIIPPAEAGGPAMA